MTSTLKYFTIVFDVKTIFGIIKLLNYLVTMNYSVIY